MRPEETSLVTARYILNNPVRAGLVANPEEYPFLGSKTHRVADLLDAVQDGVDWSER